MKITVGIDNSVRVCSHCSVKNILRTFKVKIPGYETMYIGRVCISRIVDIDTSGNPFRAAAKIEAHLNSLDKEELDYLIWEAGE